MVAWGYERGMLSQSVFGTTYTWIYKSLILFMATEFCCDTNGSIPHTHIHTRKHVHVLRTCISLIFVWLSLFLLLDYCVCVCGRMRAFNSIEDCLSGSLLGKSFQNGLCGLEFCCAVFSTICERINAMGLGFGWPNCVTTIHFQL